MKTDALITDGHWRKSLTAVRSLGRRGLRVAVGESTALATAAFSKYCSRRLVYPSARSHGEAFIEFLLHLVRRHSCRMILPMEDATVGLLSQHRSLFDRWTFLPVPDPEKIALARCKARTLRVARRLGIPAPRTWEIESHQQLKEISPSLPYPVVIKPCTGSGALGVVYPRGPQELEAAYADIERRFGRALVQERIPSSGPGFGASFLIDSRGCTAASFVHQRLREYPLSGGASTLRVSVRRDDIRQMGEALLKKMDWFGVAMVEFKLDPRDGQVKLMEINPRFWGSLALAVAAGVDFPYLLYKMARAEAFAPVESYAVGIKARWLLPGDLLHYIEARRRRIQVPGFFRFRDPGTVYDIISWDDPLPVLARMLTPLTLLYDGDMKARMALRKP